MEEERDNVPVNVGDAPTSPPTEPTQTGTASSNLLPVSILIAAVMISGSVLYTSRSGGVRSEQLGAIAAPGANPTAAPSGGLPALLAIQERDVILGDPNAPVTFIEYGDYQCPFCARFFSQAEAQIREEYVKSGKVRFVFRDLAFLGPESVEAAEAAECAKDQGKYWVYHDALYVVEGQDGREHNGNLNRDLFLKLAADNGLDVAAFTACYDGNTYADVVTQSLNNARANGVNATPISFVNGTQIQGALPYEQFKTAIENALSS